MTHPPAPKTHTLSEALVSLAARDGLGEALDWATVRAAVAALCDDPVGPGDLRRVMRRLNDVEVAQTLEDWFLRFEAEFEAEARRSERMDDKIMSPVQRVTFGITAGAMLGFAAGAVPFVYAVQIGLGVMAIAVAASTARLRLSRRTDQARAEAAGVRRLAVIAEHWAEHWAEAEKSDRKGDS